MVSSDLTTEERVILQLLAEGNRTSEIAKRLSLSYRTVADAIIVIKGKTGQSDVNGLLKYYLKINGTSK